jgi:hypothetical protein
MLVLVLVRPLLLPMVMRVRLLDLATDAAIAGRCAAAVAMECSSPLVLTLCHASACLADLRRPLPLLLKLAPLRVPPLSSLPPTALL